MVTKPPEMRGSLPSMSSAGEQEEATSHLVHGSAVRLSGKGVLLLGPSTSGKSDLALRLIDAGAVLVADDQVRLRREGDRLQADAPVRLAGLIELRGIGIMRVPHGQAYIDLAVDLEPPDSSAEQLPEPAAAAWLGVDVPKIRLDARAPSAVAKIRMFLRAERVF